MNEKLYKAIVDGKSDHNIDFNDFRNLIVDLGFVCKGQEGSHISYLHKEIREYISLICTKKLENI